MSGVRALAVVIGRAGSKGLPGKNTRLVGGRPLVRHAIEHARAAETVDRIVVSTDGDEIAAAAASMSVEVIPRPPELATDTATVAAAARHAVRDTTEPIIVILYANVPIRPPGLIDQAVKLLTETGADSVQSYTNVGKFHPYWLVALDAEGRVEPHVPNTVDRRQDLPRLLVPDGGVIAVRRECLLDTTTGGPHAFLGKDRRGFETTSGAVVDVDTALDLTLAATLLEQAVAGGAR